MEVESEKIKALIKGEVEWFKNGGKQHASKAVISAEEATKFSDDYGEH